MMKFACVVKFADGSILECLREYSSPRKAMSVQEQRKSLDGAPVTAFAIAYNHGSGIMALSRGLLTSWLEMEVINLYGQAYWTE